MIIFKILCIMLLNIDIINNWSKQKQASAETNNAIHEDVEDLINDISFDNESDPIEIETLARKVKRYESLQPHLQNLNPQQWKSLKDALNNYVIGNISDDQLGNLLFTILLPNEEPDPKKSNHFKSCSKNRTIYKNGSSFYDNTYADRSECTNSYTTLYDTTNLIIYTTPMYSTEKYSNESKYGESKSNILRSKMNRTIAEFPQTDKSSNSTIREVAVPLIIELIKTYKEDKFAELAYIHINETTLMNNSIISKKNLKREEENSDLIDILTLLTLIANMTYDMKQKPVLRGKVTPELCPYTMMSFGTSPRYTRPFQAHYDRNKSGTLVTMCYFCGMDDDKIPESTLCEDAFSRDDFSLKEYTYKFKKYCRYDEYIHNYCVHTRDKRSVWGHWTGGCSMRKIDISGVYTQRSCRNREWPTRGHHFASHRMARLEYALDGVDNGCTVSPGASLVPLSRSISLFARFIACVCPGELCNASVSLLQFSYIKLLCICLPPIIVKPLI